MMFGRVGELMPCGAQKKKKERERGMVLKVIIHFIEYSRSDK